MAGLPAKVGLQTGAAPAALVVPVEAVLGSASTGTVTRVIGEQLKIVDVSLGISDGAMVEITAGLAEGDIIAATAPGLMDRMP
ncbi:hypothetical protein [Sanguibacter sp. 25GB23B1]|uniref:hypothetical protein n=1 Tax=unclassified Sanguibacter TaxID=2645534 RepID=UPI0032AF22C4